jgi:DNA polymerase-3 subunit epsilon
LLNSVFRLLYSQEIPIREKDIFFFLGKEATTLKELHKSLEADSRFIACPNFSWKSISLYEMIPQQQISEAIFIITDIETTGPEKGVDRIIEIAAVKVQAGKIIDKFEQLIQPQKHIPSVITRLTGIKNEMVESAPLIEDVLPKYSAFLGKGIFVAHNSNFDFSFINSELLRIGYSGIRENVDLCTLRVAKKLLPTLRAKGLNGLAKHFNYKIEFRHRALGDVLATKFFLDRFIEELDTREIQSLQELIDFQKVKLTRREFMRKIKKGREYQRNLFLNEKKKYT